MSYSTGAEPAAVVVGDFRGLARSDLAVTNLVDNTVSVLLGNGDGTFLSGSTVPVGQSPRSLAVGRFRGNSFPQDLAVVNHGSFSVISSVSVLLGNGDGTFRAGATYTVGGNSDADSVAVGDFRGIGRLDLAVADYHSGTVALLLGNGDGSFQGPVAYNAGSNPTSVVVGDFNGDGRLDVVVANRSSGTVSLLLGNGNGTFQSPVSFSAGTEPFSLAVSRLRGSSFPQDLVVANRSGNTVSVLLGSGTGSFMAPVSYATGTSPWSVAVGDFDGDGQPDLAVANRGNFGDAGTVSVLLGNGNGTFRTATTYGVDMQPFAVAVGDFNRDGAMDLVTANRGSNTVSVLLNQVGATHFTLSAPASVTAGASFSLTVTALTDSGRVDPNYRGTATFSASDGRATLPANYTFAAADAGMHTFTGVVLRTAGSTAVTARDTVIASITGSTSITVIPAGASSLVLTRLPSSITAGVPSDITVTAFDDFNNVASGYRGTVSFTSTDSQATLPGPYAFTATDAGMHTFPNGVILRTAGNHTITVRDAGTLMGNAGITVNPAGLDHFAVTASVSTTVAGTPFDVTVVAQDVFNNTVTAYTGTVSFSSADPFGAIVPNNYTFTTGMGGDNGMHTFLGGATLFTSGTWDVTAIDSAQVGITGSVNVVVTPAPATFFVVQAPTAAQTGTPFDFTATATDPYGNIDTNYQGTVTFSTMDPAGTFSPTAYRFQAADHGMATFLGGCTLNTVGTWDVTVTDANDASITGSAIVSVPASPSGGGAALLRTPMLSEAPALQGIGVLTTAVMPKSGGRLSGIWNPNRREKSPAGDFWSEGPAPEAAREALHREQLALRTWVDS